MKILLVEDDPALGKAIAERLRKKDLRSTWLSMAKMDRISVQVKSMMPRFWTLACQNRMGSPYFESGASSSGPCRFLS
jgi:hypothetical protein